MKKLIFLLGCTALLGTPLHSLTFKNESNNNAKAFVSMTPVSQEIEKGQTINISATHIAGINWIMGNVQIICDLKGKSLALEDTKIITLNSKSACVVE